jgi:hypothetical protein
LFLGSLANGKVYNAFGELVHIARPRRACLAHAREYGATRQPLQRRSGMPSVKLSHYQMPASVVFFDILCEGDRISAAYLSRSAAPPLRGCSPARSRRCT